MAELEYNPDEIEGEEDGQERVSEPRALYKHHRHLKSALVPL